MKRFILLFSLVISCIICSRNPFNFAKKKITDQHFSATKPVQVEQDLARTDTQWNVAEQQSNAIVLKHKDDGHVCQISLTAT